MEINYNLIIKIESTNIPNGIYFFNKDNNADDLLLELSHNGNIYKDHFPFSNGFFLSIQKNFISILVFNLILRRSKLGTERIYLNLRNEISKNQDKIIKFQGAQNMKKIDKYIIRLKLSWSQQMERNVFNMHEELIKNRLNNNIALSLSRKIPDDKNQLFNLTLINKLEKLFSTSAQFYSKFLNNMEEENYKLEILVDEIKKIYKEKKKSLRYNKKMMQSKQNTFLYFTSLIDDD